MRSKYGEYSTKIKQINLIDGITKQKKIQNTRKKHQNIKGHNVIQRNTSNSMKKRYLGKRMIRKIETGKE